jgi:hypothetical protein
MSSVSASEVVPSAEERPAKSSSEKKAGDGNTPGTTIQYPNAFRTAVIATGVACALFAVSQIRSTLLFTNFSLTLVIGRTGHGT